MLTPLPVLVLCSALVFSELVTGIENLSLQRKLSIFRSRYGTVVDLVRLAVAALLALSFALGSDVLLLVTFLTLGCALLSETIFDSFGLDAGRHAALFLCLGLALSIFSLTRPLGYAFLLVNALAMYAWAGIFKLKSPAWRRGDALPNVLASRGYGLNRWPPVPRVSVRLYRLLSWALMLLEIGVTVVFVLAVPVLTIAVVVMLAVFHVMTGVFMGLRRFSHVGLIACGCLLMIHAEYPSLRVLFDQAIELLK